MARGGVDRREEARKYNIPDLSDGPTIKDIGLNILSKKDWEEIEQEIKKVWETLEQETIEKFRERQEKSQWNDECPHREGVYWYKIPTRRGLLKLWYGGSNGAPGLYDVNRQIPIQACVATSKDKRAWQDNMREYLAIAACIKKGVATRIDY